MYSTYNEQKISVIRIKYIINVKIKLKINKCHFIFRKVLKVILIGSRMPPGIGTLRIFFFVKFMHILFQFNVSSDFRVYSISDVPICHDLQVNLWHCLNSPLLSTLDIRHRVDAPQIKTCHRAVVPAQ